MHTAVTGDWHAYCSLKATGPEGESTKCAQGAVNRSLGYSTGFVQGKKFDVPRNNGSRDLKVMLKQLVFLYSGGSLALFAPVVKEHGNYSFKYSLKVIPSDTYRNT